LLWIGNRLSAEDGFQKTLYASSYILSFYDKVWTQNRIILSFYDKVWTQNRLTIRENAKDKRHNHSFELVGRED